MSSILLTIALVFIILLFGLTLIDNASHAQESLPNCDTKPTVTIEEVNLDVHLELITNEDSASRFRVSFLDEGTDNPHPHIDYTFTIDDSGGRQIFNAAPAGQPILHTAEGVVTIPYTFGSRGDYTANVIIYGIDFTPNLPQVVAFPCNDIPEFSVGMLGVVAAMFGVVIVATRSFMRQN